MGLDGKARNGQNDREKDTNTTGKGGGEKGVRIEMEWSADDVGLNKKSKTRETPPPRPLTSPFAASLASRLSLRSSSVFNVRNRSTNRFMAAEITFSIDRDQKIRQKTHLGTNTVRPKTMNTREKITYSGRFSMAPSF